MIFLHSFAGVSAVSYVEKLLPQKKMEVRAAENRLQIESGF